MSEEVLREIVLDGPAERGLLAILVSFRRSLRVLQLERNGGCWNQIAGMQYSQPADQVFEFANVSWPAIALEHLQRVLIESFGGEPFVFRLAQEVPHKIGNVFGAFAQRR